MLIVGQFMKQNFADAQHLSKSFQIIGPYSQQNLLALVFVQPHDTNFTFTYFA
jgi:hypothetical protein